MKSVFKGVFFNIAFVKFEGIDYNQNNTFEENFAGSLDRWERLVKEANQKKHILPIEFEFLKLKDLIESNKQTIFYIIRPPETNFLKGILPQNYYDKFVSEFNKYDNVFYRDFSNLKLDYNEYFSDLSHLNSNGMRLFTKIFIEYFKNSQK